MNFENMMFCPNELRQHDWFALMNFDSVIFALMNFDSMIASGALWGLLRVSWGLLGVAWGHPCLEREFHANV